MNSFLSSRNLIFVTDLKKCFTLFNEYLCLISFSFHNSWCDNSWCKFNLSFLTLCISLQKFFSSLFRKITHTHTAPLNINVWIFGALLKSQSDQKEKKEANMHLVISWLWLYQNVFVMCILIASIRWENRLLIMNE